MATRISKATASQLLSKRPQQSPNPAGGSMRPTKSKFKNVRTWVGEDAFDSRKEAERWLTLRALERAGEITDLERQVSYDLTVGGVRVGRIKPDFRYRRSGELVVEDVKSKPTITQLFRWKAKHLLLEHGIALEIVL